MSIRKPTSGREANEIYRDWRFGISSSVIAVKHGMSQRNVNDIVCRMNRKQLLYPKRKGMIDNIQFPAIAKWMYDNGKTLASMAREIGIGETTLRNYLGIRNERGTMFMPKHVIDRLLRIVGMSYERAFKTKSKEVNNE